VKARDVTVNIIRYLLPVTAHQAIGDH